MLTILFLGDIVGKAGRELTRRAIPILVDHLGIDLVVANVENAAGGVGITRELAEVLFDSGVDVMTSGNHIWDKREIVDYIDREPRLLRPANYPAGVPGRGRYVAQTSRGQKVAVINVMGRLFMLDVENPFTVVLDEVAAVREEARVILVDFHAEATSEKLAMGWHLDGRVTAVVGTHTHVQTADDQILPGGTAYITDAGMTGPHDSVIGVDKHAVLERFLKAMPARFEAATGRPRLNGAIITADEQTGKASAIERLSLSAEDVELRARKAVTVK